MHSTTLRAALVFSLTALLTPGCSGEPDPNPCGACGGAGGDGGGLGSAGGTGGSGGGSAGGAAGGAAGGSAGGSAGGAAGGAAGGTVAPGYDGGLYDGGIGAFRPGPGGLFVLTQSETTSTITSSATFWNAPTVFTENCTRTSSGPCKVKDCNAGLTIIDGGMPAMAGTVTVQKGASTGTLSPMFNVFYQSGALGSGFAFTGGEPITFAATGTSGGAPAFSTQVAAPPRATFVQPAGSGLTVTRGAPLDVTWSGGKWVVVQLSSGMGNGRYVSAECVSSTGSLTIPAGVTQAMLAGNGMLKLASQNSGDVSPSGWNITAHVVTENFKSVTFP